jgi:hypothetical protein
MKLQLNQYLLMLIVTHLLLAYADNFNRLSENSCTVHKLRERLLDTGERIGIEVN